MRWEIISFKTNIIRLSPRLCVVKTSWLRIWKEKKLQKTIYMHIKPNKWCVIIVKMGLWGLARKQTSLLLAILDVRRWSGKMKYSSSLASLKVSTYCILYKCACKLCTVLSKLFLFIQVKLINASYDYWNNTLHSVMWIPDARSPDTGLSTWKHMTFLISMSEHSWGL